MAKLVNLDCLLALIIFLYVYTAAADDPSTIFSLTPEREQQLLFGQMFDHAACPGPEAYAKISLKHELQKRLSKSAGVHLREEETFSLVDARYTNYKRPEYIAAVQVAEEKDVVEVVNYARSRGIKFAARAGGHGLTTSLRRITNAIAIDMRGLNSVKYDENKRQVTVGGGITTGEFANATHALGMEVTVGSCPCTGVLGISLGAGIGRLQGKYGYLNDNMVSVRLLLANGTIVEASDDVNPDLFWALRGAGHNFGIALEATYQVYPQQNEGQHYVVDFEFTLDKVESIFEAVNAVSDPMPEELAIFVIGRRRGANGEPTINVNLVYSGPPKDAEPYVRRFDVISPVWKDAKTAAWDALPWATYNGLNNVLCTPEGWARFPVKNFYGANVKRYDIPTMRDYFDGWRHMNQKYGTRAMFSVMFESFAQQRVRGIPDGTTAYPWRHGSQHFLNARMIEAAYDTTEDGDLIDDWLSEQQDKFIKTSGYGRLQQYVNYGHGSKDPPEALYGYEQWRLQKLRRLKGGVRP
ncbi:FAD-linked oxidoreductase alt4 [Apiospora saccharicola]|uniref:FAD-linked oxidoreductase alt4 n=1 Tax=Apiospora saccharicola TaxID=335842 RepID=A0ABR1U5W6_9PEZI